VRERATSELTDPPSIRQPDHAPPVVVAAGDQARHRIAAVRVYILPVHLDAGRRLVVTKIERAAGIDFLPHVEFSPAPRSAEFK